MNNKTPLIISLLLAGLISSCNKKDTVAVTPHEKAVYAIGYYNKAGKQYLTVWKNGNASVIDSNANPSHAFVTGSDLFIAGYKNGKAFYWKNGTPVQLITDASFGYVSAYSLFVSGTDVHIAGMAETAGTYRKQAVYWKNNVPTLLNAGPTTEDAWAHSIFVSGHDVYIAGKRTLTGGGEAIVIWKNGVPADLVSSVSASFGNPQLYVSGNDVYITCYEYEFPNWEQIRLWKNGNPVPFPVAPLGAVPNCLLVIGNDIYIGGFERGGTASSNYSVAKYWKNGAGITVGSYPNGSNAVKSIYLDGKDLYVAGVMGSSINSINPIIQKNGTDYTLNSPVTNPYGEVNCVIVK